MSLAYRIAFASLRSLTPALAEAILARLGSEQEFFELTSDQLSAILGFRNRLLDRAVRDKALADAADEETFISRNNIRPIYFTDPDYPRRLRECEDAPLMIYTLGNCDLNASRFVSIVGTRHSTAYGAAFVEDLVNGLADKCADPVVIVSGLAYGIDVAAHRAALAAGLPTIGVLAHGLNTIYPASHRDIAARMVRNNGMLLTDYRSCDNIHKGNFLARNRIVAGISDVTVVVESDFSGGAMSTARMASAYGREVMALPGRVNDTYSRGTNQLIASGVASLIRDAGDLIDMMNWPRRPADGVQQQLALDIPEDYVPVLDALKASPDATVNDLCLALAMPFPQLSSLLFRMELDDYVVALPGGRYAIPAKS